MNAIYSVMPRGHIETDQTALCYFLDRAMRKRVFGHMRTARPGSECAYAQSDRGLRCPLIECLETIEYFNGKQIPG